jgi:thiol-disulfide isomerase/thioredoxin
MVKLSMTAAATLLTLSCTALAQEIVLYDFYSPSCAPCRRMEPAVAQLMTAGYPVRKVNIMGSAEEQAIASQFQVTKVPSFVMVVDGRETERVTGATSYARLEQIVQRAAKTNQPARPPVSFGATAASHQSGEIVNPWTDPRLTPVRSGLQSQPWPPGRLATQSSVKSPGQNGNHSSIYASSPLAVRTPTKTFSAATLINSTVRLRVQDDTGHSWGTGTLIDARGGEALIITCGHIFRDSARQGPVHVELFHMTPAGPKVLEQLAGQVIHYDLNRDIGLVSVKPTQETCVAKIARPGTRISKNDLVQSVGCNHGANPTVAQTHITAINRYLGAPNIEAAGSPVEGRSGGGLFNDQGQLIGICYAADPKDNEGLYTGLESVHEQLTYIGLSEIYATAATSPAVQSSVPQAARQSYPVSPSRESPFGSSQNPLQTVKPAVALSRNDQVRDVSSPPGAQLDSPPLSVVEQAAWHEIMSRAAEAEVICIVRPKSPQGKSEVFTLSHVSREFVRRLVMNRQADRPDNLPLPTSYSPKSSP